MSEPKGVNGYLITKRADGWHLINFHGDSVAGVSRPRAWRLP